MRQCDIPDTGLTENENFITVGHALSPYTVLYALEDVCPIKFLGAFGENLIKG